ncbi:hypothetical protein L3X38_014325 [Prunus dulcis]|uniref:PUM-HD domain-containing protein n=1 Tax=Prunus dulcis TaxID=3755 RepID=A0AAD4ZI72_PRUDU|nr:hypothetical protein L3X38_014325 [Prunus dulcis]
MVTDTYSKMMSEMSMRSMLKNGEDLSMLIREQRRQHEASEREKEELNLYRSGSAPPTVEGSLNAVGGLFEDSALSGFTKNGSKGFATEEELRADPAYRFQGGGGGGGGGGSAVGGIGDRRIGGRSGGEGGDVNRSLFSVQPGVGGKEENGVAGRKAPAEWGGDGLIGLPGLGLGSRQKSIAEIIQDDIHNTNVSRHPSRPASRNAFDDGGMSAVQNVGSSGSHTYASALGASLSRSTTPDPQLIARAPSPRIPPVGGGRASSMDKKIANGQNSFNGASPNVNESADLAAALSGMNLSANGRIDEENHARSHLQHEIDNHHNLFDIQGDRSHMKQNSYLNKPDSGNFHLHSVSQSSKNSYQNMGRGSGFGRDLNHPSYMSDDPVEINNPAASANSYLRGPVPGLNGRGSSFSQYQNVDSTSFPNYGLGGYSVSPSSPSMMGNPLGNGSLPPLFENAAAASAMGGLDPGAFGGGMSLGPNLLAAAAELQNMNRLGNHTAGSAVQVPMMGPLYLQYLRSNEYAAAQVAALNDPTKDREGMALGGPLLPNSPVGPGSPARHSDRNLRFSSGMRNMGGGLMGAWHSETGGNFDENFASTLLDEFKSNKTKCFELSEIAGHVVEFRYGSRFIQQKLETATAEEKNMVFDEIMPQALSLMTDVFGNYVIQKFFEHGNCITNKRTC